MKTQKKLTGTLSALVSIFITQNVLAFTFNENSSASSIIDSQIISIGCHVAEDNVNLLTLYHLENNEVAPKNKFKHKLGKLGLLSKAYNDNKGNYIVKYSDTSVVPSYFKEKYIIFLPREKKDGKVTYATTYCITNIDSNGAMQSLKFSVAPYKISPPLTGSECGRCYYIPTKDILSTTSASLEAQLTNQPKDLSK